MLKIWSIKLYTSNVSLSGSSTDLFIKINGNLETSGIIFIKNPDSFKYGRIKRLEFYISEEINFGKIESVELSIPRWLPFYYDWNMQSVLSQLFLFLFYNIFF